MKIFAAIAVALCVPAAALAARIDVRPGTLAVFVVPFESPREIDAAVDLAPGTLERSSQGEPVVAFIELPPRYDSAAVIHESVRICAGACVNADRVDVLPQWRIKAIFDRGAVLRLVPQRARSVVFTVSGSLTDPPATFSGADSIKVVEPAAAPAL